MGWLTAITEGFSLVRELSKDIKLVLNYFKKAEEAGWFKANAEAFRPLINGPTTKEQKDAAAKAIADSIGSI